MLSHWLDPIDCDTVTFCLYATLSGRKVSQHLLSSHYGLGTSTQLSQSSQQPQEVYNNAAALGN
jgi:hypothetical protein